MFSGSTGLILLLLGLMFLICREETKSLYFSNVSPQPRKRCECFPPVLLPVTASAFTAWVPEGVPISMALINLRALLVFSHRSILPNPCALLLVNTRDLNCQRLCRPPPRPVAGRWTEPGCVGLQCKGACRQWLR